MKRFFLSFVCIVLAAGMFAQEKYVVPERTVEQKHNRTLFQLWIAGFGGGISFAKSKGVTPYDYGVYLGKTFSPGWGTPNDFDALVEGSLLNFEDCRISTDPAIVVSEKQDGSVSLTVTEQMYHRYFSDGNGIASFDEYIECMRGVVSTIADYLGATATIDVSNGLMTYTYRRK